MEEVLKKKSEIVEPDQRQRSRVMIDTKTGCVRPLTVQDLHAAAEAIILHDGVPEAIRSHFAAVKNLIVYSWFYYPFNSTAMFLSYVTIELALRQRFSAKPGDGFKSLVRRAVQERLISDEGFSHVKAAIEEIDRISENVDMQGHEVESYVDSLIKILPQLRNEFAHGAHILYPAAVEHARIAMEFINQLFVRPLDSMPSQDG